MARSRATTKTTYDLQGATLTSKVYPGAGGTGTARTTTTHFDAAGNATGTEAPIAPTAGPAPLCPDDSSQYCNSVLHARFLWPRHRVDRRLRH